MEPCTLIHSSILKPFLPSSIQFIPNSLIPLTIFDKASFDVHVPILHAFKPPIPSNEVLKNALSKVLIYFPHLAGRLTMDETGHQCIVLNNAGIRLIETYVPTTLADEITSFDPSKDVSHLHPPIEGIDELLQIQLNRYACGGIVIGSTGNHRIADGQSWSYFYVAWSRLVRGLGIDPLPYHDRDVIILPRKKLQVNFDHRSIEFPLIANASETQTVCSIEKLFTHFTNDFIIKIKEKVANENFTLNQQYSTFECLLAHVWKKVTQARCLKHEQFTQIRVAVNGRGRTKPLVPMEYFGNFVLDAIPRLTVGELIMESYAYVTKVIHDAVSCLDSKYFQSFVDFGELCMINGEELEGTLPAVGNVLCPNLEADNWLRLNLHDLDFGGGPCAFFYPNILVEGVLIFLPSIKKGGGIDVIMSLLPEHVQPFKRICHSL